MPRLAILCTHPIQYHSPVFVELAKRTDLEVRVFYGCRGATEQTLDPGFGQNITWDIPLLDGYEFEFVDNVASDPGSHHFRGVDLPSLVNEITDWNAESLLVYGWCYKSHLAAMRHFKSRIPVLFRGDSTVLSKSSGWRAWLRTHVLRWVYRNIDVALYVGTHNREYFVAHGLRQVQLVFAPHAVDNVRFANSDTDKDAITWRRSLSIGDEDVVFLLPAKLESIKSPGLLADAFADLDHPGTHLVFAGSGPLEESLRARKVPRVHFLGFQNQSQMPTVYRMADLVVLPSQSETWGLALNEAMACCRAVLATNRVGAAIDLIQPGRNGWILPACDRWALHSALEEATQLTRAGLQSYGLTSFDIISDWTIPIQADCVARAVFRQIAGK